MLLARNSFLFYAVIFLKFALINIAMMLIIGYLTLDVNANRNSQTGAYLLSVLMPYLIVLYTQEMTPSERVFKFGLGLITYFVLCLSVVGLSSSIACGIIPCLLIAIGVLFFGKRLVEVVDRF